jgi:hypothetical protein
VGDLLRMRITGIKRYVNGDIFVLCFEDSGSSFFGKIEKGQFAELMNRIRMVTSSNFAVPQGAIAFKR